MPPKVNVAHSLNPFSHFSESVKAPAYILYHRLQGGGALSFLYTSPWGTYDTLKWLLESPDPPNTGSLEVSRTETDAKGFALYGMVRTGGVNVIPSSEVGK